MLLLKPIPIFIKALWLRTFKEIQINKQKTWTARWKLVMELFSQNPVHFPSFYVVSRPGHQIITTFHRYCLCHLYILPAFKRKKLRLAGTSVVDFDWNKLFQATSDWIRHWFNSDGISGEKRLNELIKPYLYLRSGLRNWWIAEMPVNCKQRNIEKLKDMYDSTRNGTWMLGPVEI